ncbi:MAG: hypothetical protein KF760_22460 [Candidatus Eremiobacteraeota bacterium]|nr:hypothetical protein [Candidatus Eremiobacteraeota bacterium]MCW5866410.1 hypothetical protein [Candidatus Eremiobacteraeota bacterium]
MLKKTLLALGLSLSILLPASADMAIDSFKAYKQKDTLRYQITLHNVSDVPQQGPILIHLYSRPNSSAKWAEVQSWDVEVIDSGAGWTQELDSSDELATAKANSGYECNLVVTTPNAKVEKTAQIINVK